MQEVMKINSKKEVFDIKMTLKLIKMNENAIDKSLLKIKKAANFDEGTEKVPFGIKDLKNFFKTIF